MNPSSANELKQLSLWQRALPAITLALMAPLLAEVLPGATRFGSLFVLPIEMCVWGGGALLIRYAIRLWHLDWMSMLLLALALAIAEECVIQQTSLAPMVIRLKGETYARAFGVNYVYFFWALFYESVFVVFLPIHLVELIFSKRRADVWLSRVGLVIVICPFLLGSVVAWFLWTRIVRLNVFHVPIYQPPLISILVALATIGGLVYFAIGFGKRKIRHSAEPLATPSPWLLGVGAVVCALVLYGLVLLGFGISPTFPPWLALSIGLIVALAILILLPRWCADQRWKRMHTFAVIFGMMLGMMGAMFLGFVDAAPRDLYFKIVADALAVVLMIMLAFKIGNSRSLGEN